MVLKQDSPYYEHFYHQLKPWEHYVPVRRDLSDLKERVLWAQEHDDEAYRIAQNARKFANENLLPQHIVCYHAVLFSVSARDDSQGFDFNTKYSKYPKLRQEMEYLFMKLQLPLLAVKPAGEDNIRQHFLACAHVT